MLQLRYNGCPECLNTVRTLLRNSGLFSGKHYSVEFHTDHRSDKIYEKRGDYLEVFTGAILYNPDTQHWVDFYSRDHEKLILNDVEKVKQLFKALEDGE